MENIITNTSIFYFPGSTKDTDKIVESLKEQKKQRDLIDIHIIYPEGQDILSLINKDPIFNQILDLSFKAGLKVVFVKEGSY